MSRCLRRSFSVFQTFSRSAQIRKISRTVSSKNLVAPQPDGQPKAFSPKVEEIANSIAQLNLIEVAELSDLLKKKLNLPDAPAVSFATVAAPATGPAKEDEEATAPSLFSVKLKKYDEKQKVPLIKEVKNIMEGMNLVQAKKFVESAPVLIREGLSKEDAEKLKDVLTKAGGEVELV